MNSFTRRFARTARVARTMLATTQSVSHTPPRSVYTRAPTAHSIHRTYASDAGFTNPSALARQAHDAMSLGTSALTQGNAQQAQTHLEHALQLHPTSDAHYNMGICQYMLKNIDCAIEHWKKSVQMDPKGADAYVSLGNAYFLSKKESGTAIDYMQKAIELAPNDPEIQFNLACMHESQGSLDQAIELYTQAASNGLDRAQPYLRNAMAKRIKQQI
ncbi:hypothetical protein H4S00_001851 [Coemansia sp. D1744]|nr:hypothetical protein IWW46_000798 [Coemansia sp. RSA 2440]KAJ2726487.1 hypothetical protein H4S00_001851 [Coemansia sp. D1744]